VTNDDTSYLAAEARARRNIDRQLAAAGWVVQDRNELNLYAGLGVAVREFVLASGHGKVDYLLYVAIDGSPTPVGVIEAKPEGKPLAGVELQSKKYTEGLPDTLKAPFRPLPLAYESTGVETMFTSSFDPEPRSRQIFWFFRPETIAAWVRRAINDPTGGSLRARLVRLPEINKEGLRRVQVDAIEAVEESMHLDHPRALAQMATGSGKTFMAATESYRLIKFSGAQRILFLVDRANLGRQALHEFQQYSTPDDGRKFTDLYNVQVLGSGGIDPAARVVISTVQRLYSELTGAEIDDEADEKSAVEIEPDKPVEVGYNSGLPIESFDVVVIDECHRSIYGVWRQVIEYFDAFLIGLTATPGKQTFGFFKQNLVIEYGHDEAVADGVNVDFDVYRIRTEISGRGSTVEAGLVTKFRNRDTRAVRLEKLDDDVSYDPNELDRTVVAEDQIRTIIQTFKDNLLNPVEEGGIFPGRTEVPKTLIFAKTDSHADDIVRICREVFGKGNDFAVKITYRTTGEKPENLLAAFRNTYNPRIAVTVDMIATGTDVKPLECLLFMRSVKSRTFFEQMVGRGVRTIDPNDLQGVTADALVKDHFVVVDAVGVTDSELVDSQPLERMKTISLERILDRLAAGERDPDLVKSVAGRLARLDRTIAALDRAQLEAVAGESLSGLVGGLVAATDPDGAIRAAAETAGESEPSQAQVEAAAERLIEAAVFPIVSNPTLRTKLVDVRRSYEQMYDELSQDRLIDAGFSADAADRAKSTVASFRQFIEEHHDEIEALSILYSRPYGQRLTLKAIRELANTISRPPYSWTPERLWSAYEALDLAKVHGSPGRMLTNLVSLVRYALDQDDELFPYRMTVNEKFQAWRTAQELDGRVFTSEQLNWLERIRDHVATSLSISRNDFEFEPFSGRGGFGKANEAFEGQLDEVLAELNQALAA
jgi:type I restriction enzyme R subunit